MANKNPDRQVLIELEGENFRKMRLTMELTQPQLAEILSFKCDTPIDVKTISKWESGKAKLPAWADGHLERLLEQYSNKMESRLTKKSALETKKTLSTSILERIKGIRGGSK